MLTVAFACVCVESFLGLDGRTWKGPSRRPGEPGALGFSTEPYCVLRCPFLSCLTSGTLLLFVHSAYSFEKANTPYDHHGHLNIPHFSLLGVTPSVKPTHRWLSSSLMGISKTRLSKHYFLSPKPFSHFFQNVPSHSDVVIGDIFKINHLGMA